MKALAALPALALLAACSQPANAPAEVTVSDAWCRPAAAGAQTAACYLKLAASADDRLTAVASPAAERVEIHATDMSGGIMRMHQMEAGLPLPAGETTALAPGGTHLMLISPKSALTSGDQVSLTLSFETAPGQTVQAQVRTGGGHGH